MAIILKLLLLPVSLLFYWIKDSIMGGSSTKEITPVPAPSTQITQNSSGFHIMEFHGATIGSGAIVLLIILAVCVGVCYGYSCLRRCCKKSMMQRYFGKQPQKALPYSQQMVPLQQPQAVVSMPAPLPAPQQPLALPAPTYQCASACTEVVPYKPGYKYCLPPGTQSLYPRHS